MLTTQASIAAACYAIIILTTRLTAKEKMSSKALHIAGGGVAAFVAVCIINCYVTGDCGVLAWAFTGLLMLAAVGALGIVYTDATGKNEGLIIRDDDSTRPVPLGATPP